MSELILSKFETGIVDLIEASSGPGRNCGRNAIYHMRKAWEIKEIDREMAMFRGLTAEEESSTAIINELREKKYKGASKLEPTNHVHTMALTPFLLAFENFLARTIPADQNHQLVLLPYQDTTRIQLRIKINHPAHPELKDMWMTPIPPLHGSIEVNGVLHDFANDIQEVVDTTMTSNVKRHLKDRAEQRNALLYARPQGMPQVTGDVSGFLKRQQTYVFKHLAIFLMIYPYDEKQHLVQQTLQSFLKMLGLLKGDIEIEQLQQPPL